MRFFFTFLGLCYAWFSAQAQQPPSPKEQVLIFMQGKESSWVKKQIDSLTLYLQSEDIPHRIVNLSKARPEGVTYTPFIMYQNVRGQVVYQGRYTTFNRVRNFVRTSRQFTPTVPPFTLHKVYARKQEAATIFLYLKITPLAGKLPANFDAKLFQQEAMESLVKGFKDYRYHDSLVVDESALAFYFDVHPYMGEDGTLYLSYEIFSKYDCITPIFSQRQKPVKTNLDKKADGFSKVGTVLEKELGKLMFNAQTGDARWPLPSKLPVQTFEQLGLLPPKGSLSRRLPNLTANVSPLPALSQNWVYLGPTEPSSPSLSFRFPAPLTTYGGEASQISGSLSLDDKLSLAQAKAQFEVGVTSVTMGIEELDKKLQENMFLVSQFSKSTFTFKEITGDLSPLQFGKLTTVQIKGEFEFKGKTIEVLAPAEFEPIIDDKGKILLHIKSFFRVDQLNETYGLELPPGPPEANNSLIFHLNFLMQPKP